MTNILDDVFKYITMSAPDECWPWKGPWGGRERDQRPIFNCGGTRTIAYRVVYELVNGTTLIPTQLLLHSCDKGARPTGCCNPAHLRIGTIADNSHDMKTRERHGLTHHMVNSIRRMLAAGRTQQEIADICGVSRETISAIATARVYAHVEPQKEQDNG